MAWMYRFLKNKNLRSRNFGESLELLARFELATRSSETLVSLEPYDLAMESALRAWDSVASVYLLFGRKRKNRTFRFGLELLARFELATSSLPRMRSTC